MSPVSTHELPHTRDREAPGMRAPRSDAAANRRAILDAAAIAVRDDPDASIDLIAAGAGLTRRAVYGHFASRDELIDAVLIEGATRIGASILKLTHPDARVEIALYGATLWAQIEHARMLAHLALRGPHGERVTLALAPARERLRETVARGARERVVRTDVSPQVVAALIESAAIAVLDLSVHEPLGDDAVRLVMLNGLSVAGLDWATADRLISDTPELSRWLTSDQGASAADCEVVE